MLIMDINKPPSCILCSSEHELLDLGNNETQFASEYRDVVRVMTGIVIHQNDSLMTMVCRECIRRAIDNYDYRRNARKRSLEMNRKRLEKQDNSTEMVQCTTVLNEEDDDVQFVSISIDITGDEGNKILSNSKTETGISNQEQADNKINNSIDDGRNSERPESNCDSKMIINMVPKPQISIVEMEDIETQLNYKPNLPNLNNNQNPSKSQRDSDAGPEEELQPEAPSKKLRRSVQNLLQKYPKIVLPDEVVTGGLKDCTIKLTHKPINNFITKLARRVRRLKLKRRKLNSYVTDSPKRLDVPDILPTTSSELKELIVSSLGLHRIGLPSPLKTPTKSPFQMVQTPKKILFQPDALTASTPMVPEELSPSKLSVPCEIEHPFYALPVDTEYKVLPAERNCETPKKSAPEQLQYSLMKIVEEESVFVCHDCNQMFKNVHVLKRHQKIHKRCVFCSKWFKSSAEVRKHVRTTCPKMTKRVSVRVVKMETNQKVRKLLPPEFLQAIERSGSPQNAEICSGDTEPATPIHHTQICSDLDDSNATIKLEVDCDTECINLDLNPDTNPPPDDLNKLALVKTTGNLDEQRLNEARHLQALLRNIEKDIDSSLSMKTHEVSPSNGSSISVAYTDRTVVINNLVPHLAVNKRIPVRLSYQPKKLKVHVGPYSPSLEPPKFYDFKHITPISLLSLEKPAKRAKQQTVTQILKNAKTITPEQPIIEKTTSVVTVHPNLSYDPDKRPPKKNEDVKMQGSSIPTINNIQLIGKIPTSSKSPSHSQDHQYHKQLPMSLVPIVQREGKNKLRAFPTPENLVEMLHNGEELPSDICETTMEKVTDIIQNMSSEVVKNLCPVSIQNEILEISQVIDTEPMIILDSIDHAIQSNCTDVHPPPPMNSLQNNAVSSDIMMPITTTQHSIKYSPLFRKHTIINEEGMTSSLKSNSNKTTTTPTIISVSSIRTKKPFRLTELDFKTQTSDDVSFVKINIQPIPPPVPSPKIIRLTGIQPKKVAKSPKKTIIRHCFPQTHKKLKTYKPKRKDSAKKPLSQPPLSEVNANNVEEEYCKWVQDINVGQSPSEPTVYLPAMSGSTISSWSDGKTIQSVPSIPPQASTHCVGAHRS